MTRQRRWRGSETASKRMMMRANQLLQRLNLRQTSLTTKMHESFCSACDRQRRLGEGVDGGELDLDPFGLFQAF